jgi:hypothetical protein
MSDGVGCGHPLVCTFIGASVFMAGDHEEKFAELGDAILIGFMYEKMRNDPDQEERYRIAQLLSAKVRMKGATLEARAVEEEEIALRPRTMRDPQSIRYTQGSVGPTFTDERYGSVDDLVRKLRAGEIDATSFPPIRVVERDGVLWTLDNRRLEAFRQAGVHVPTVMAYEDEVRREWRRKFTTKNDGESVTIRRGNRKR